VERPAPLRVSAISGIDPLPRALRLHIDENMSTVILPAAYRLTYADWLRLPDDGRLYEVIDGELFMNPPPGIRHQRVSRKLGARIDEHLEDQARGEMFFAPTGVRLSDDDVVEPDLLVVLTAHADRITEQVIDGAPDLAVEILSPGTARRDLVAKRGLYARSGVPEYWIVDSEGSNVEVLTLERGAYTRFGLFRRNDVLRSALLPDLAIPLDGVFQDAP
jgi:Uma2 family endonuclease